LSEEYFPEERRDQFIYRGKKVFWFPFVFDNSPLLTLRLQVIIECQKHDDYQESIKWLLSYAEEYAGHGKKIAGHGKDSHAALTSVSFATLLTPRSSCSYTSVV
jgi:hypothetical protein